MSAPIEVPEFDPDNFEPVHLGPTWERNASGEFVLPALTLGHECLRWCFEYLKGPDGGPWRFTAEQARLILWWYALDEQGNFVFRSGVCQRCKGWGKDPLVASISAFELCGNCRFSHWDADGRPVGKQPAEPWIQIAAVSRDQTRTTMKLFPGLFNAKAKKTYDLKIGRELIHAQGGIGRIEAVTSSPETLEGGRPSLMIANESHLWYKNNEGHEMAKTGRRNAGKVGGRVLAITNAPQPGRDSVAERDRRAYEEMISTAGVANFRLMYDSLEAPSTAPLTPDAVPKVLLKVRGDSYWFKIDEVANEILDSRTPPSEARRFYYNQLTATEDALIASYEWDQCLVPGESLQDGDEIVLGLDPSKSDDATALIAIRINDRLIQPLGIWEIPPGPAGKGVEIDMERVSDAVAIAFAKYKVRAFFSDVNPVQGYIDQWSDQYREQLMVKATPGKSSVGYDMRGNQKEIMQMNEALVGALRERTVKHNCPPGAKLREHALNAYQRPKVFGEEFGMSFGKESRESSRKVDGYAATVLAYTALNRYLESGRRPQEEPDGSFYIFQ